MTALPPIDPAFAAGVIGNLPSRLAKKLAGVDPATWTIGEDGDRVLVRVGTATVTITGPAAAGCDCLLAPRCLHLAGVLSSAPVAEDEPGVKPDSMVSTELNHRDEDQTSSVDTTTRQLTTAQLACCELAAATLTEVLDQGLTVLTAPARAGILRVVALARSAGLHRLAAAFTGLHTSAHAPTRRSVAHLRSAALAVQVLRHGQVTGQLDEAAIGTARRVYRDIGVQRLRGFVAEPILTDSGYAGVAAHFLAEGTSQLWTVSAVTPGDLGQIRGAYRGGIDLGALTTPIADAVRGGLLLAPGTGSADHRLGRGRAVRASVREPSTDPWPAMPDWWTGRAVLDGIVDADPYPLLRLAPSDGDPPPSTAGLSPVAWQLDPNAFGVLAGLAGDRVELILRVAGDGWEVAAIDSPAWQLERRPVFPGLDRLLGSALGSRPRTPELPEQDLDFATVDRTPEGVLNRWSMQVALRGRRAVTGAEGQLADDRAWLESNASPHRASVLGRLGEAARAGTTAFDGSFVPDPSTLLTAWLAVSLP